MRIPAIVAGALTIAAFYFFLRRAAGIPAAVTGTALLAADPLFIVTTALDFGPVALQHLFATASLLFFIRFHQESKSRDLFAGCLCLGLGLWDKAVFAWILIGMIAAAIAVFPSRIRGLLTTRNLWVAGLGFCLGAAPLIWYNTIFPLQTFRSRAAFSADGLPGKARNLRGTLNGSGLFGFVTRQDRGAVPGAPANGVERASLRLSGAAGREFGLMVPASLLSLAALPFLWRSRLRNLLLFCWIAASVAWVQMALTSGAGTAVHHVILLWPLPIAIVAVTLVAASEPFGRFATFPRAAALIVLAGASMLVANEYFARLVRNGAGVVWTDAAYPLAEYLRKGGSSAIYIADWGFLHVVRMLSDGELPLRPGDYPLSKPELLDEDRNTVAAWMGDPGAVIVSRVEGTEMFPFVNKNLRLVAEQGGYRRELLATITRPQRPPGV
jgi:hypothetical protein